jgi:hypothetical protein
LVAVPNPRIALLPGYRTALMPGMRTATGYIRQMLEHLPAPLELSLLSFTLDRRLGLFFSSPVSLLSLLKQDQALLEFFRSPSFGDDVYALLLMERSDSLRFGVVNQGGEIRADVAQTVVSFDHHRLALASPSLDALRERLPGRAMELLLQVVSHRLVLLERERVGLDCELTQVRMRLSALSNPGLVLVDAMPSDEVLPQGREALLARLSVLQQRLSELKAALDLSGALGSIAGMLADPDSCLRLSPVSLCLDRMGIVQTEETGQELTHLLIEEVLLGADDSAPRVVLPVHVSRQAIADLERCVADSSA